jgi:hypothetical protein
VLSLFSSSDGVFYSPPSHDSPLLHVPRMNEDPAHFHVHPLRSLLDVYRSRYNTGDAAAPLLPQPRQPRQTRGSSHPV